MLRKIESVEALPNHRLRLTFAGTRTVEIDFTNKIAPRTVTAPLLDDDFFKRVRIIQGGRAIGWPGEIDFCADALWLEASGEANPYDEKKAG